MLVNYLHHLQEASVPRAEPFRGASVLEDALPTPFAYVDVDVLARNLDAMAAAAAGAGLALRPHVKTHKLAAIARCQLELGAAGLTTATLGEAEALVAAGVETSYLIAHPFWSHAQVERFAALARTTEAIACVDSVEGARRISDAARASGETLAVSLIVDTGYHRFGVEPEQALALAQAVAALPGLRLHGIRSHAGHAYGKRELDVRRRIEREEIAAMTDAAERIRGAGIELPSVSIGSTPGARAIVEAGTLGAVDEMRPGNYCFYDRQQVSMGAAGFEECALTVVASVVSHPRPGVAILDAGKLTLSSTDDPLAPGYGRVRQQPDALVATLSQECATVERAGEPLQLGARVSIVPNHACEITNLAPLVWFGSGGRLDGAWEPEAARRSS